MITATEIALGIIIAVICGFLIFAAIQQLRNKP